MGKPSALARWRACSSDERRAIVEAVATLMVASAIVRFSPFRAVARIARRPVRARAPADAERVVATIAWAVGAVARRARFRAVCIEQGLAAQAMLRRRGIATTLHYGVANDDGDLAAHVWVRWGERDVVGCREAPRFRLLASFSAEAA